MTHHCFRNRGQHISKAVLSYIYSMNDDNITLFGKARYDDILCILGRLILLSAGHQPQGGLAEAED